MEFMGESVSDRVVLEKTGHHPDEWFAFLDAQSATTWTEHQTLEWLVTEGQVSSAGARVIAERYRQLRGLTD